MPTAPPPLFPLGAAAAAVDAACEGAAFVFGTAVHRLPLRTVMKAPAGRFWSDIVAGTFYGYKRNTRSVLTLPSLSLS